MKLLSFTITAESPLAFPVGKPGRQFRESFAYVPGGVIYGALGMLLGKEPDGFDNTLFQQLRCYNAYPVCPSKESSKRNNIRWVRPIPMTAMQPKDADEQTPICDSLVARVCYEQQQPTACIYSPTDENGRPWESVKGKFYTSHKRYPLAPSLSQRVLTRVAINHRRGTAEDQRLYSLLAISEVTDGYPTQFRGSIGIPDSDTKITDALKEITHLGGRQTSGLGKVHIAVDEQPITVEDGTAVNERIAKLTSRFRAQATLYESLGGKPWATEIEGGSIFTINLLSDAILFDQGWIPTYEITVGMLQEWTGITATPVRAFTNTATLGGWNVSWRRPKPTTLATKMGSVFVFHTKQPLDAVALQKLADLQQNGIGERRAEGYGQVRICDEFHLKEAKEYEQS